jgi:hypothetical protein
MVVVSEELVWFSCGFFNAVISYAEAADRLYCAAESACRGAQKWNKGLG